MIINLNKVCRSCKSEATKMNSIFKGKAGDRLADLLNTLTNIGAHKDDGLPSKICIVCTDELNRFHTFKLQTERSDQELKIYLQSLHSKHESHSSESILDNVKAEPAESVNIKVEQDPFTLTVAAYDDGPIAVSMYEDDSYDRQDSDFDEKPDALPYRMDCSSNSSNHRGTPVEKTSKVASKKNPVKDKVTKEKAISSEETPTVEAQISEGKFFQCSACKTCFGVQVCLRRHISKCKMRSRMSQMKGTVNCKNCETSFRQISHLNRHIANKVCLRRKVARKKAPIKKYHCAHCNKVYERRHKFLKHLLVHGFSPKFPCRDCDLEFEKDTMREHVLAQHTLNEHLCPVCGKVFALNNSLRTHLMRHNPDKAFKCTECPFSSIARADLESHMTKHTGEHPFECDICGHRSTTRSARARHKRIHTGEKKHACDLCPMRFAVAYGLKNHRRTHTGEKPYACSQCDRTFTQRTECVWHERSHIEGYMFQCTLCPMAFTRHSALKEHRKTHAVQKRVRQSKDVAESIASIVQPAINFSQVAEPIMLENIMRNVSEAAVSIESAPINVTQSPEPIMLENMIKKQPI